MSKKQIIYQSILDAALPRIRNILSKPVLFGSSKKEAFELAQLVHNIPATMLNDEFSEHDIWFLNIHAKNYAEKSKSTLLYDELIMLIVQLRGCVPDSMRSLIVIHSDKT